MWRSGSVPALGTGGEGSTPFIPTILLHSKSGDFTVNPEEVIKIGSKKIDTTMKNCSLTT